MTECNEQELLLIEGGFSDGFEDPPPPPTCEEDPRQMICRIMLV